MNSAAAVAAPHLDQLYATRHNYKINFLVRMPSFFSLFESARFIAVNSRGVFISMRLSLIIIYSLMHARAILIIYDDVFNLLHVRCAPGCSPLCVRALFSAALAHNHAARISRRSRVFFYWVVPHQSSYTFVVGSDDAA
jgi:hypothetical protein